MSCIFIACFVLTACSNKPKASEQIAINDMKTIMWDMENADIWFNQIPIYDSVHKTRQMNIQLYEQVFASHNITKQQFYKSYLYYQTKPDQMKILIDSVVAYGERVKASYKGPRKY
ncbi:DUF4296 domain-containing protein [Parasediminibacterium paludis]|uniref:DUF4296 domain-containing protein n=1 Tax=Parasediminibacterium paludis TaxID=908966 RepID=A0ABV8PWR6_9BACT